MQALASATKAANVVAVDRSAVTAGAQEILGHFPTVMNFIRRHMRSGRAKGLSVPQFRVLVRAEEKGTLSDVAACLGTSLPTASRIVSGLVTKGYLHRVECVKDRRVRNLSLTTSGQRVLRASFAVTQRAMEAELAQLTDAECRGIAEALRLLGRVFSDEKVG